MNLTINFSIKKQLLIIVCILVATNFSFSQITSLTINNGEVLISACENETIHFGSEVEGSPIGALTYQWEVEGEADMWEPLDCSLAEFSGCDLDTLTITSILSIDSMTYRLVIMEDDNGMISMDTSNSVTLSVFELPLVSLDLAIDQACANENPISLTGGMPEGGVYSFAGNSITDFDPAEEGPGVYNITYTFEDENSCSNETVDSIEVFDLPIIDDVTLVNPSSCGGNDAAITIAASAGTGPIEYSIDDGDNWESTDSFSGLTEGSYSIKIRNANGSCEISGETVSLSDPNPPLVNVNIPGFSCQGASVQFSAEDAGDGATYSWDFGAAASPSTGTGINPEPIIYADGGDKDIVLTVMLEGCENSKTFTYTAYDLPTVTLTLEEDELCKSSNSLTLSGGTSDGEGTYSGMGVGADGFFDPSSVDARSYEITYQYTDANGCASMATDSLTVYDNPVVEIQANASDDTQINLCEFADLVLTSEVSSGTPDYDYSWEGPQYSSTDQNPTLEAVIPNQSGDYSLTVSDENGCTSSEDISVMVVNAPSASFVGDNTTICEGGNLSIDINGTNGAEVSYLVDGTSETIPLDAGGDAIIATGSLTSSTIYLLTEIQETTSGLGCTNTLSDNYEVIVNATPSINPLGSITECNNASIANINFSGSEEATFGWTNNMVGIGLSSSGTGDINSFTVTNNSSFTNPVVATILVTPAFENNEVSCSGEPEEFTITVNPSPLSGLSFNESTGNLNDDGTICNGDPIEIEASGGVGYNFMIDGTSVQNSAADTYTANDLSVDVHEVEVIVENQFGCQSSNQKDITVNQLPDPQIAISEPTSTNPAGAICRNEMVEFTGSCNDCTGFFWNDITNSQATFNPGSLAEGMHNFSLEVVDDNGCINDVATTINVYPLPMANFIVVPPPSGEIFEGNQVLFVADNSPNLIGFSWDFGDCGNILSTSSLEDEVVLEFTCPGTQDISLQVIDQNDCQAEVEEEVIVRSGELFVEIKNPLNNALICQNVAIESDITIDNPGNIATIERWFLITAPDSSIILNDLITNGTEEDEEPEFTFTIPGIYTLRIDVIENISFGDTVFSEVTFEVIAPPSDLSTFIIDSLDEIVCLGEPIDIGINILHPFYPDYKIDFTITQMGGIQIPSSDSVNNFSTIQGLTASPGTYEYTLDAIEDANGCATTGLSNTISYLVAAPPEIQNQNITCISPSEFTVVFDIIGGSPPFTITDSNNNPHVISENIFTSEVLALDDTGTSWEFSLVDANGCSGGSISGTTTDCSSSCLVFNANTSLDITETEICEGSNIQAIVSFSNTIGATQGFQFLLQNNNGVTINDSEIFTTEDCLGGCSHIFEDVQAGDYTVIVEGGEIEDDQLSESICPVTESPIENITVYPFPDSLNIEVDTMCVGDENTIVSITTNDDAIGMYEISINGILGNTTVLESISLPTPNMNSTFLIDSLVFIPFQSELRCATLGADLIYENSLPVFELPIINAIDITDANMDGNNGVGELITFTANTSSVGPLDYSWNFNVIDNNGITSVNSYSTAFTASSNNNSLVLIVTDNNECESEGFMTSFNIGQESCPITITNQVDTICADGSITFTGGGFSLGPTDTISYEWTVNGTNEDINGPVFIFESDNSLSGEVEIRFSYNIVNSDGNGICSEADTTTVYILETPNIQSFDNNGEACLNQQLSYLANMSSPADQYTWTIDTNEIITENPFVNVRWEESGDFNLNLMAVNDNGCSDENSLDVNVDPTREAPTYYDLFQIEREGDILVGYPDSTLCYEWNGANNGDDFVLNANTDNTLLDVPRNNQYYIFSSEELATPKIVWVNIYGENGNCTSDECTTTVFYEFNEPIPTLVVTRSEEVEGDDQKNLTIEVYPNPNNGRFSLEISGGQSEDVFQAQIVDLYGRKILERELVRRDNRLFILDLNIETKGIYFLRLVDSENKHYVEKILVH